MKFNRQILVAAAAAAGLSVVAGSALAESQYGYGTGAVSAQAKLDLEVNVSKLILLRVGAADAVVDTLTFDVGGFQIPAVPTTPVVGNNQNVDWDGTAPTLNAAALTDTVRAYAWTSTATADLTFAATPFNAGGPALADITVDHTTVAGGGLPHPGADLANPQIGTFAGGAVRSSDWNFTLGGTPAGWAAGTYTSTVTYTATAI